MGWRGGQGGGLGRGGGDRYPRHREEAAVGGRGVWGPITAGMLCVCVSMCVSVCVLRAGLREGPGRIAGEGRGGPRSPVTQV